MSPLTPMEQLSRLDSLSPKFTDRLKKILRGQRYRDYVANLQGDDLSPLVEYFDKDLATLQRTTSAYFLCWLELWRICGNNKILPQSHLLSDPDVAERPVASIGPCDVYEGSLGSSKVRVRRLRVYSIQGPKDNKRVLFQEAVVWKRLVHENIVPFLGVNLDPLQLISEWVAGGDLSQYVNTNPSADRIGLLLGIANGLSYLHSHGVIHGNLKGPSILVDDAGCPRLTDFAFSCITFESGSTASKTDGHAVRWAAPEVLDMKLPVSKASDVFSFAMVIIETFTGKPPFNNNVPTAVAVGILAGSRPERPTHPNLTDNIWNLTQRCWDKDTKQRPNISEIVLRLQTIHGDDVTLDGSLSGSEKIQQHESSGASGSQMVKGGWLSRYRGHPNRNQSDNYGGLSEKQETVPVEDDAPSSPGRMSFRRFLVPCTGATTAESHKS